MSCSAGISMPSGANMRSTVYGNVLPIFTHVKKCWEPLYLEDPLTLRVDSEGHKGLLRGGGEQKIPMQDPPSTHSTAVFPARGL